MLVYFVNTFVIVDNDHIYVRTFDIFVWINSYSLFLKKPCYLWFKGGVALSTCVCRPYQLMSHLNCYRSTLFCCDAYCYMNTYLYRESMYVDIISLQLFVLPVRRGRQQTYYNNHWLADGIHWHENTSNVLHVPVYKSTGCICRLNYPSTNS